jgi:hypothetical protein
MTHVMKLSSPSGVLIMIRPVSSFAMVGVMTSLKVSSDMKAPSSMTTTLAWKPRALTEVFG